jgi:hypothetical protein
MITLWLTSLLRNTHKKPQPTAAPKKTKKVDSRKEKTPTTLSERFEPAKSVAEEKAPARSPSPPPQIENRSEVYLTENDLPDLSSAQSRTDFMNSLFPNDKFSYPSFPHDLNHAEIRSLSNTVKMYLVKLSLCAPVTDKETFCFRISYLLLLQRFGIILTIKAFYNRPSHSKDYGFCFSDTLPSACVFNPETIRTVLNDMDYLTQIYH